MKRKLICMILILLLLLTACGTVPASTPQVTDTPAPVETPEAPPESTPEPTPEPTPENSPILEQIAPGEIPNFDADVDWNAEYGGDISWPPQYATVYPCVLGCEKPEFGFGSALNGCDALQLPSELNSEAVFSLQQGQVVEVLARVDQTWDRLKFGKVDYVWQAWYMIATADGQYGWVKAEELEACEAPENFSSLRYKYSQGVVIDGCELSLLPGGEPAWALPRNTYVEIIAAVVPEGSYETWLYVYCGNYANFHSCLWVKAGEIKQYTSENMYDTSNHVCLVPGAKSYWANGVLADAGYEEVFSLLGCEDGLYWLSGAGGMVFYVESFDDLIWPEPIESPAPSREPRERPYSGELDDAGWIENYGYDISRPLIYDTVWPAVLQYIKPEFDFASAVSGCDVVRHPQPSFFSSKPEVIYTLQPGETVEVLSRTDATWYNKQYDQPWYMIATSDGVLGWVKVEELEACAAPESFNSLRYEYSQGVVIDGCELFFEPNGQPVWALPRNDYVEIIASFVPEGSYETWLYIHWGRASASHNCSWVKAGEIKQYTAENMYDTQNHVQVREDALAFFENGKLYEHIPGEVLYLSHVEEDGTCWLSGSGGLVFYVESIDDLIWPEPIE